MGWQGRILRVDLTAGTCVGEPLNRDWVRQYLGQRGLGTRYLVSETDPKVDPLAPGNRLIFATGPLTGTMASTGGRYSVITKGALTGAVACSNSGGYFGAELKFAGWDMIIFEGKAAKPVYLYVENDRAELRPAAHLWGTSAWEVEPALRAELMDPQIRIASIGRAGENLVRFACVVNDLDRVAGRSGVGAVMGSKNLKALAVRGTKGVTVDDPGAFMDQVSKAREKLDPSPGRTRLSNVGTHAMLDTINAYGGLPTYNNREVQFEGVSKINAASVRVVRPSDGRTNLITNKACFACSIGCGRVSRIDPTHFTVADRPRYLAAGGGLEFENAYAFGPMVGVDDVEAMTYANFVCNEHGMDTMSFGSTLAAAMELYDIGAISKTETGGIALEFGSAEALARTVELTANGEGFGRDLGLGAKRLCDKYGRPEFAMVVKGQELAGYDPRVMRGMGLAYATSNRGGCHLRARPYADDFTRLELDGKARIIKDTQDEVAAVDSAGLCLFIYNAWTLDDVAAQVNAACEGEWAVERLRETGERIWNMERRFNLDAGFTRADDTLPKRMFTEPAPSGTAKGMVAELDGMLGEYYQLRGWTKKGVPTAKTLQRLGL